MVRRKRIAPISILILLCSSCAPGDRSYSARSGEYEADQQSQQYAITPLVSGSREYNYLRPVEVPEIVRERSGQATVQDKPAEAKITNPHMVINVDKQSITLTFDVNSSERNESIELVGLFDRKSSPWKATLYATDKKILEERRVQAVALCLTANYCDVVGVNIYYKVKDRIVTKQLQSGVKGPRVAMSGDGEAEAEDGSESAVKDDAAQDQVGAGAAPAPAPNPLPTVSVQSVQHATAGAAQANSPAPTPQATASAPQPSVAAADDSDTAKAGSGAPPAKPSPVAKKKKAKSSAAGKDPSDLGNFSRSELMDRPIEYYGEMKMDPPEDSKYRIEGLPVVVPDPGKLKDPVQAIGAHDRGWLQNSSYIPPQGTGFVRAAYLHNQSLRQENDPSMAWGTLRMVEFLTDVGGSLQKEMPGGKITINAVSRRTGGRSLTLNQVSHQTGLDVDVYYESVKDDGAPFAAVDNYGRVTKDFDVEKNWRVMKSICRAKQDWLIVIFVDRAVKQSLCSYAKRTGELTDDSSTLAYQCLRSLSHWDGHKDHFHVRLYCPNTSGCIPKLVDLPKGTGC